MIVAGVRVGFGDAESKERERKQFEGFAGGHWGRGEGREKRTGFLGGFFVGRGLEGAEGAFDWRN